MGGGVKRRRRRLRANRKEVHVEMKDWLQKYGVGVEKLVRGQTKARHCMKKARSWKIVQISELST